MHDEHEELGGGAGYHLARLPWVYRYLVNSLAKQTQEKLFLGLNYFIKSLRQVLNN